MVAEYIHGVIEVNNFKSGISYSPPTFENSEVIRRPQWPQSSEATKVTIKCNMHIDVRVIQVADLKFKVKFNILYSLTVSLQNCLE